MHLILLNLLLHFIYFIYIYIYLIHYTVYLIGNITNYDPKVDNELLLLDSNNDEYKWSPEFFFFFLYVFCIIFYISDISYYKKG